MWIHSRVLEWFESLRKDADTSTAVLKEALTSLREELAVVRTERDQLRVHLAVVQNNSEWLRSKVNQLEFERAALIEKAYNVRLPAIPEVIRTTTSSPPEDLNQFSFEDVGDRVAAALGLPLHDLKATS